MKLTLAAFLFLMVGAGTYYLWVLLDTNNKQNGARAQKCYEQGEAFFKEQKYKEALWSYEAVSEFYSKPHTNWADLAEEKQWICRAYLNDWTSSKGKWNGDLRELKPHLYEKYKAELISITPVAQILSMENTTTPVDLMQTPILTTAPTDLTQTPTITTTPADLSQTPILTTTPTDPSQTPTLTATFVDLTPTPSPGT